MVPYSIGGLAFSMVIREPGFRPKALPSPKAPGVHPAPSVSGWERREVSVEALTRGIRGQVCRQHTLRPIFPCYATWLLVAVKTLRPVVFLGEPRQERRNTCIGELWLSRSHPDICQHGGRHGKGSAGKKIDRITGCCF